jgi:flavin-dependent dehydrogenase
MPTASVCRCVAYKQRWNDVNVRGNLQNFRKSCEAACETPNMRGNMRNHTASKIIFQISRMLVGAPAAGGELWNDVNVRGNMRNHTASKIIFQISRMLASAPAAGGELHCELLVTAEGVRLCHATTGGVKPGPSRQGASCPATSRRAATCPPFFHIFYSVVDFIVLSVKSHFLFFWRAKRSPFFRVPRRGS